MMLLAPHFPFLPTTSVDKLRDIDRTEQSLADAVRRQDEIPQSGRCPVYTPDQGHPFPPYRCSVGGYSPYRSWFKSGSWCLGSRRRIAMAWLSEVRGSGDIVLTVSSLSPRGLYHSSPSIANCRLFLVSSQCSPPGVTESRIGSFYFSVGRSREGGMWSSLGVASRPPNQRMTRTKRKCP